MRLHTTGQQYGPVSSCECIGLDWRGQRRALGWTGEDSAVPSHTGHIRFSLAARSAILPVVSVSLSVSRHREDSCDVMPYLPSIDSYPVESVS